MQLPSRSDVPCLDRSVPVEVVKTGICVRGVVDIGRARESYRLEDSQ